MDADRLLAEWASHEVFVKMNPYWKWVENQGVKFIDRALGRVHPDSRELEAELRTKYEAGQAFDPDRFAGIEFDPWIACYSDMTHEYGIGAVVWWYNDEGVRSGNFSLPDVRFERILEGMYAYERAQERLQDLHYGAHDEKY